MEIRLDGKTALVTGAGRNLGRSIALSLAEAGAAVVVNARTNREEAEAVVREIEASGGQAVAHLADVGDVAAVAAMVDEASRRFGPVDILVNNAAIRPHQPFLSIEPEDWDNVIRTNLSSAFYGARAALPAMMERGFGRIINISGIDGVQGAANRAHNVACKAGIIGFTKALALECGPKGVTVNAVVPGAFDTTRDPKNYPNWPPGEAFLNRIPARRLGRSEEVGHICTFLASAAAAYITGQSIHVNGGLLMV